MNKGNRAYDRLDKISDMCISGRNFTYTATQSNQTNKKTKTKQKREEDATIQTKYDIFEQEKKIARN